MSDACVVHHDKIKTNGPFGDIKETIGGYIHVKADSIEEAAEFAKRRPVLQGAREIEEAVVRKIWKALIVSSRSIQLLK